MKTIPMEIWQPSDHDPNRLVIVGQRTAQEVFAELYQRLESIGYLPDDYLMLDSEWKDGREIPQDAYIFCTVDYGVSEGIYVDVYLKWYENRNPVTKSFATGKTLGDTGADMDRMNLISSAITKAFHGDGGHTRFGNQNTGQGVVLDLSAEEQQTLIDALLAHRERMMGEVVNTEQLLRRVTGSITEFVNAVGHRPLKISDLDMTVLAIQDGNLEAFKDYFPKVLEHGDVLLPEVAGRPGAVGKTMTSLLLPELFDISRHSFLAACKKAVDTGDLQRVLLLTEQGQNLIANTDFSLFGELFNHVYFNAQHMANPLIKAYSQAQIAAVQPKTLVFMAQNNDTVNALALAERGVKCDLHARTMVEVFSRYHSDWVVEAMLKKGLQISPNNYPTFHACVTTGNHGAAKILLDQGLNFEEYLQWTENQCVEPVAAETLKILAAHAESLKEQDESLEESQGMSMM